jgi:hypothetical protein
MAREKRAGRDSDEPQAQQEEMTVIVLKFKGGSQSLQKGFEAVSQALSALGEGSSNNHRVVKRQPQRLASPEDKVIEVEDTATDDTAQETPLSGNGKVKKPQASPRYKFINDFDLSPSGVPSLKDYCMEKDPQNENDKFLVASAWIQTHGGTDPFSGQHLFTCFRAMEWKTQGDMTQPAAPCKTSPSLTCANF